jgi:putative peptidoglycan binding protein
MKELRRHGQDARHFLWGHSPAFKTAAAVTLLVATGLLISLATTRGWFSHEAKLQQTQATLDEGGKGTIATTVTPKPDAETVSKPMLDPSHSPLPTTVSPDNHSVGETSPPLDTLPGQQATKESPPPTATPPPKESDVVLVDQFLQDVRNMSMIDSAVHATAGLLQAWKVEGLQEKEWSRGSLDLAAIARGRQLEYLPLTGSANLLSLLDLPMIMELVVPGIDSNRFVLLLGLSGDRCRVFLDRERELPLHVLNDNWFGKGYVFWKDFEGIGAPLTVGSVGQNVRRLHAMLTKVQGSKETPLPTAGRENVFSRQTEEAVARFQRAKRLTPDGVAGPLTMILLYNSLATYAHPSLGGGITPAPKETPVALEGTTARVPQEGKVLPYEHNS